MVQMGLVMQGGCAPEVLLSDEQNRRLAIAVNNVRRHFPSMVLTEKQEDIIALCMCAGTIGWTQFSAYQQRKAAEKRGKAAPTSPLDMSGLFQSAASNMTPQTQEGLQ